MSTEKSRSAKQARAPRDRRPIPSPVQSSATLPKNIGKYAVVSRIGVGAMGVVYKCSQPGLNRPVAIKVLTASKHSLGDVLPRFQREARAASRLNHPSVVQVYDVGTDGELHYIVMEYVDGWSLDKVIGSPALTVDYTLRLLIHIARALQAAHDAGIVHRDIKPSNILIHRSGQPKLVDFGLAKSLHDGPTLSRSGDILGTPRYMSPEQVLMSPKDLDTRTDIYSLGAVMYEMLTVKPPVEGPNVMAMLRCLTDEEPPPVRQRNPAVPEAVAAICHKALAKDREHRFATAGKMAEAMQNVLVERLLGSPQPIGSPAKAGGGDPWNDATIAAPTGRATAGFRASAGAWLRLWRRRALFAGILLVAVGITGLVIGWPAHWIDARWYSGTSTQSGNAAAVDQLVAQARDHLTGTASLRANATPRERLGAIIDDLTVALKQSPKPEIYSLRARAYRMSGEYLAAIDDGNAILRQQPTDQDAILDRLLARYQLHILYLDNFNEAVLRPDSLAAVRDDLETLLQSPDSVRHYAAKLIDALARQSHGAAVELAEAGQPPETTTDRLPDLCMLRADALYHAAGEALAAELAAPEDQKPAKRQRRQEVVDKAGKALQHGLDADPQHVGLLFLRANAIQRQADWLVADGDTDRDKFLKLHRPEFESACDRLRNVTLRLGPDTPIARTVLWNNFDRQDMALDQVKDAITCRPTLRHLYTIRAWLSMHDLPSNILNAREVERILTDLQPTFETPPDTFNAYFVHALLQAAGGQYGAARSDLQQCERRLGSGRMPSDNQVHNEWFARANASTTEYLDYTQTLLDQLNVPGGRRILLGEEVLKLLADPEIAKRDNLDENAIRTKKGWTHHRLARLYAERKDRGNTLKQLLAALEAKLPNLTPATFKNDSAFVGWANDEEFVKIYAMFEQS
jgi:tetratricopeptide (TPR) repeat protein/predicted Ser/Thr protein kinase